MKNMLETIESRDDLLKSFSWLHEPDSWSFDDGKLVMVPKSSTDFFRSPTGEVRDSACLLSVPVKGDFTAVAHMTAELIAFADAGAVTVRESAGKWAKICMERSPIGDINVVSVVTDGLSDDATAELIPSPDGWLRITRRGNLFGMHHSRDGKTWRFVRAFPLDVQESVDVGIHAQAPYEHGCSVIFDFFGITDTAVTDFRSGE